MLSLLLMVVGLAALMLVVLFVLPHMLRGTVIVVPLVILVTLAAAALLRTALLIRVLHRLSIDAAYYQNQ